MKQVLALVVLAACASENPIASTNGDPTGIEQEESSAKVVVFTIDSTDGYNCATTFSENIIGAAPPASEPATDGWVNEYEYRYTESDLALLTEAADGTLVLSLWGDLYIGVRDGDTLVLSMTYANHSTWSSAVEEAGFHYDYTSGSEYTGDVTVAVGEDGAWAGALSYTSANTATWNETDVYDGDAYASASGYSSFAGGTLSNAVFSNLDVDSFGSNTSGGVECEGADGSVVKTTSCAEAYTITLVETDVDPSSFQVY